LPFDWLANQTDHIPVFSWIVSVVQSLDAHWILYVIFFFLAAIYAASLFIVAVQALSRQWSILHTTVLLALLTLLHCAWVLPAAARYIPGLWRIDSLFVRLASLATNGVAGQYIVGPYLQRSAFGVPLITSIAFFLHKREIVAEGFPQFSGQGIRRNYADGSTVAHRPEVKGSTPAGCVWPGAVGYGR
jgi:hypothetical protein